MAIVRPATKKPESAGQRAQRRHKGDRAHPLTDLSKKPSLFNRPFILGPVFSSKTPNSRRQSIYLVPLGLL